MHTLSIGNKRHHLIFCCWFLDALWKCGLSTFSCFSFKILMHTWTAGTNWAMVWSVQGPYQLPQIFLLTSVLILQVSQPNSSNMASNRCQASSKDDLDQRQRRLSHVRKDDCNNSDFYLYIRGCCTLWGFPSSLSLSFSFCEYFHPFFYLFIFLFLSLWHVIVVQLLSSWMYKLVENYIFDK